MSLLLKQQLETNDQQLSATYLELAKLYDNKLWHQLMNLLETVVHTRSLYQGTNMVDLYTDFLSKCETKLNPMRVMQFCCLASIQFFSSPPTPSQAELALNFIRPITLRLGKLSPEAGIVGRMREVELLVLCQNLEVAETMLAQEFSTLNRMEGNVHESIILASYYHAESALFRVTGPPDSFFHSMMQYYQQQDHIPVEESLPLAVDVAISALVSETVFSFGEVLRMESIMRELQQHDAWAWLGEFLSVFNRGDIVSFNKLVVQHQKELEQQATLFHSMEVLRRKIALQRLVNMVFERPSTDRNLTFVEISQETYLPLDQVEWLVMSAFSKQLLRGSVDEIDQSVHISWVLPRVLTNDQCALLVSKLDAWQLHVQEALQYEQVVPELFASS